MLFRIGWVWCARDAVDSSSLAREHGVQDALNDERQTVDLPSAIAQDLPSSYADEDVQKLLLHDNWQSVEAEVQRRRALGDEVYRASLSLAERRAGVEEWKRLARDKGYVIHMVDIEGDGKTGRYRCVLTSRELPLVIYKGQGCVLHNDSTYDVCIIDIGIFGSDMRISYCPYMVGHANVELVKFMQDAGM